MARRAWHMIYTHPVFKGLWASKWGEARRDPLGVTLGSLEREVMDVVWQGAELTVRDVHDRLPRPVAYTTVMTTLDRLFKKGFVTRTRSGRAFVYAPACTREQVEASVAGGVLGGLLSGGSTTALPILSNLVDAVSAHDDGDELLDALESMVQERRRKIARGQR